MTLYIYSIPIDHAALTWIHVVVADAVPRSMAHPYLRHELGIRSFDLMSHVFIDHIQDHRVYCIP